VYGVACLGAALAFSGGAPTTGLADSPAPTASSASGAAPLDAGKVRAALDRCAEDLSKVGGKLGADVVAVSDAKEIASRDALTPMNPASNAKIPTAIAALTVLGPERRFVTGLYGKIESGRVARLVLRGTGDPGLETDHLAGLGRDLEVLGVKKVGSIAVDQSRFDDAYVPPAFDQQPNEWAPFRAPVAPVSLARNTVTLWFTPAAGVGEPATITVDPPGFVDLEGSVSTSAKDKPEKIGLAVEPKGGRLLAKLSGTIPLGSKPVPGIRRVDDPRLLAGYALRAVLRRQGIETGDEITLGGDDEKRLLASHRSATVGELLPRLGKDSDNFAAEMLFKAVGAEKTGSPKAGDAAQVVEALLRARGAFDPGMKITNGSGLFDANRLTAHGVATALTSGARDPAIAPELISQLAIGGVDGTLRGRFGKWKDRRAIRAKTGTLAKSVALSGFILDRDGRPAVAFSFLVEAEPGKAKDARAAIDRAVSSIADLVWR
jgi:D-alanyl-D-alanine carboxypeptidase/D-alanyl-D-alanine-endopeptidase (penicillin-binding protein 4)